MMGFALKLIDFAFKMMDFVGEGGEHWRVAGARADGAGLPAAGLNRHALRLRLPAHVSAAQTVCSRFPSVQHAGA